MTIEQKPTVHFYPLRPSELVANPGFLADTQALSLSVEERQAVTEFEKDLYEKFRKAKSPKTSDHTIYPGAFETAEGMALFSLIYLKKGFWQEQKKTLVERGVNFNKRKERDKAYEAIFNELVEKAKQNSSPEHVDIQRAFEKVGLSRIPKKIRELANAYSRDWAQGVFVEQFRESDGDLSKVDNPARVSRIVSPSKLSDKLEKVVEQLEGLTVLELSEVVKALQDRWGVSAMPVAAAGAPAGATADAAAEGPAAGAMQTVMLTDSGANKIGVIKALREINPQLGLKEAKDLTEKLPAEILKDVKAEEAKAAADKLTAAGAKVELK